MVIHYYTTNNAHEINQMDGILWQFADASSPKRARANRLNSSQLQTRCDEIFNNRHKLFPDMTSPVSKKLGRTNSSGDFLYFSNTTQLSPVPKRIQRSFLLMANDRVP